MLVVSCRDGRQFNLRIEFMNNPTDLISQYRMLSTANVSDGLDRISFNGTPLGIGSLSDACSKIVGPACTLKIVWGR